MVGGVKSLKVLLLQQWACEGLVKQQQQTTATATNRRNCIGERSERESRECMSRETHEEYTVCLPLEDSEREKGGGKV